MSERPPDRTPVPFLQPGALLDDWFEIGELLGEGGTSLVYAGKERPLHRHAAIKIRRAGKTNQI